MNLKERAKQLKTDIPALFLALKGSETPIITKIFAVLTILYALSPIDLIPDFIPVLGYVDDIILLPALISLTIIFIPKETFEKYRIEAQNISQKKLVRKWYYAVPVLIIWLLILWSIIKAIFIRFYIFIGISLFHM